jgi:transketolase
MSSSSRARILLSKGHALYALAATLAEFGYSPEWTAFDSKPVTSDLCWHPGLALPGIALKSASLCELLAVGAQLARTAGLREAKGKVFVIGNGAHLESALLWDSLQFMAAQAPQRVVLVIENHSPTLMRDEPFTRFDAFGWDVRLVDGHSLEELREALHGSDTDRPRVVVADTRDNIDSLPSHPEAELSNLRALQPVLNAS